MILVAATLGAIGFPAPSSAAELDLLVSGRGSVVATIAGATAGEDAEVVCTSVDVGIRATCVGHYLPGRVVGLRAEPVVSSGPSSFGMWSDDRCPPTPTCEITLESDRQAVVASFSPQLVVVGMGSSPAPGGVTSVPAGLACDALPAVTQACRGEFPLFAAVDLSAEGVGPAWGQSVEGDQCDAIVGTTCSVTAGSRRDVGLTFSGGLAASGHPSSVDVDFRIAKDGTGSGTARSESLNCGHSCTAKLGFGSPQTFVADPDRGSRFVGWRGACGANPRCRLVTGPVTRITAVFDSEEVLRRPPAPKPAPKPRPSPPVRFQARLGSQVVVRGIHPRRIVFSVSVSGPSSIRAVLENARGRRVTSRTWNVGGARVLRLGVPGRARRGTYVLSVTARDGHGHVKRFERRVRVRR